MLKAELPNIFSPYNKHMIGIISRDVPPDLMFIYIQIVKIVLFISPLLQFTANEKQEYI